jgi:1-deoxy-D-xylulose-5-phosphate reductoisomerase
MAFPGKDQLNLAVLGATGSIGASTLDVVSRHAGRYRVFALSANGSADALLELCRRHKPRYAVLSGTPESQGLRKKFGEAQTELLFGAAALEQIAAHPDCQTVMAAIVGAAGLPSTLAAARAGKRVLLANKEALVMTGPLMMAAAREGRAQLLPVDSEHNAVFQCFSDKKVVRRILLTASGGPFRTTPPERLESVTPEQACAHPNWVMGRKISVDSATMMNKGLEIIEAHWLFGAQPEQIQVVVHPQSVVHSMVEYADGSVIAQLGHPDMRTPIAQALAYPERIDAGVPSLDLFRIGSLGFERPDFERFPALGLAYAALKSGGAAPATLNAANEVAVAAFLEGRLPFLQITAVIEETLNALEAHPVRTLEDVLAVDAAARMRARQAVARFDSNAA